MKINSLLFLIFAPIALHAYTVDDLESAIKETNESGVEEVVKNIQVTANDKKRILILAEDMLEQRKIKYQSLFAANNSFLRLFDYSRLKIMAIAGSAGLVFSGITMDIIMNCIILCCHADSTTSSYYDHSKKEVHGFMPLFTALSLLSAGFINIGVRIKYFYDT